MAVVGHALVLVDAAVVVGVVASRTFTYVKTKFALVIISGVNFTNVLRAAFMRADPKSAIKLLNLTVFFALLGSARIKAARRTLVKLTPDHGSSNGGKQNHVVSGAM